MSSLANITRAALIIRRDTRPSLIIHRRNPKKIELVLAPVFGFYWAKQLSTSMGAEAIKDFYTVQGTALSKGKIDRVRLLFKETFYAELGPIPLHFALWRALISSFRLYAVSPFTLSMEVVSSLEQSYLFTPLGLSVISYLEALALDTNYKSKGALRCYGSHLSDGGARMLRAPQLLNSQNPSISKR